MANGNNDPSRQNSLQIAIAIISVVGVLGAALLANWEKVFPHNAPPPSSTASNRVSGGSDDTSTIKSTTPATKPATQTPNSQTLAAPMQLAPPNGSIFSNFPRSTQLVWDVVPGAVTYTVEIDCFHCCQAGVWCTDVGKSWKFQPGLTQTTYSFDWVGAQKGRWRTWAIGPDGRPGTKSGWFDFQYTQ